MTTLEDRMLSLGREEEKGSKAEAEAAEEATRTARGKVSEVNKQRHERRFELSMCARMRVQGKSVGSVM